MNVISRQTLDRLACEDPADAVLALQGWAAWWLTDETISAARQGRHPAVAAFLPAGRPTLPREPGGCWVVCAVSGTFPYLRPAVVLPLVWRKGESHSARLPFALRALADEVAAGVGQSGWRLHPAFDAPPLADDLFRTLHSGWASVAGGLVGGILGLPPDPRVWASVAWADGRTAEVGELTAKVATAAAFGAANFFVHESQSGQTVGGLKLAAVGPAVGRGVWEALRDYLAAVTSEPAAPAEGATDEEGQFQACVRHFLKLRAFTARATEYYASHLMDSIVRRYRDRFRKQVGDFRVRRFVTVVSHSPELVEIVVKAIRPERVLLLFTLEPNGEQEAKAREFKAKLEAVELGDGRGRVACELAGFQAATAPAEFPAHVARFTAGVPESEVVLDLKPGTKKMTYSVIAAARPGHCLLNMEPEFKDDRRNTPGTEVPELLPPIPCHPPPPST